MKSVQNSRRTLTVRGMIREKFKWLHLLQMKLLECHKGAINAERQLRLVRYDVQHAKKCCAKIVISIITLPDLFTIVNVLN
jgi:hypothetical protein